jgi:hypothetical protein
VDNLKDEIFEMEWKSNFIPLTPTELLETFPNSDKVIKRNIKFLIREIEEKKNFYEPFLDLALEGVYLMKDTTKKARELLWIPLCKYFYFDRFIEPLEKQLKYLEKLLVLINWKTNSAEPTFNIEKAKSVPIISLLSEEPIAGMIHCPFHHEKTASCKIYDKQNKFYCFGCGKNGDVIDLVMKLENVDWQTAVIKLNK